jgi:hypothetical protein
VSEEREVLGNNRYGDKSLTAEQKIKVMVNFMGYTQTEAAQMLEDAGEIDLSEPN